MTAQPDVATPAAPRLEIEMGGRRVELMLRRRTSAASPHTGRELEELHGWTTTADADTHRWLAATLRGLGDRSVTLYDEQGDAAGDWRVSWNSYAEKAGVHTYTLILHECEELNLEVLVVGGVELYPYEYREEHTGGGLTVWARLVGTDEDVLRLRGLMQGQPYLPVIRRGIQEEPRRMRLGVAEWSEFEDRVKYRVVLVEEGADRGAHPELARIERENRRAALGFYMNFAERLVELLVRKGVLTREELQAVREEARAMPVVVRHEFWHVPSEADEG